MSCPKQISEKSTPAFNTALNIFQVPPTNVAIHRSFFRDVLPLNTLSASTPCLFRLFNDNLWIDLSRVYLCLDLIIERLDDATQRYTPLTTADAHIGAIQAIGQTFIRQLKVEVGTTEVYNSGELYAYKAYITNELSYSINKKASFLASIGYHPTVNHNDANDDGFKSRVEMFAKSRKCRVESRLDFDLGNQELYMINNLDILFTISRNSDAFLLQTLTAGDTSLYRLKTDSIKLRVKMLDVQPSLNNTIYDHLKQAPAKYAVRKTEMRSHYLTEGRTELHYNVFTSVVPRRLTIGFVARDAFNGDLRLTPFNFQPFALRELSVHAGGEIYPHVPYDLDFVRGNATTAYVDMYEALGAAYAPEGGPDIRLDQYLNGWTFFVVPLTSTLDDSCGFELVRSGTTSIHLKFARPIPENGVEMICMGEFDSLIMIDAQRRVIADNQIG